MRKNMWEIKQAADGQSIDLYIYGDVQDDDYNFWTGETIRSETSANAFREELAKYPNATQINVYINSYGGSVFEGTAIYNQLRRHPAHKTVYVDGFACSIALMMIHNMWMCTVGNSAELRKAANDLDIINNAGRQAYLAKTGEKLDEGRLTEMMDAETWLTAEECIALGLADRYAQQDADMSKAAGVLQKANLNLEQRISLQKSLAAQLRQLTEVKPKADLDKKEKQEQPEGVVKMLAGIFMPQK